VWAAEYMETVISTHRIPIMIILGLLTMNYWLASHLSKACHKIVLLVEQNKQDMSLFARTYTLKFWGWFSGMIM